MSVWDDDSLDLATLAESVELECKAAQGRDGRGELPDDFWKTYSAMANTEGGVILLGVQEKPRGQFRILGLADVERVRKAVWDNLHNRKQISINLLSDADVQPVEKDGHLVLRIRVPRAIRQSRPVHLGTNPLGGTYLRRHEGDYQADDETVRRLLAERVESSRDERVLKGFDFADLDMGTIAAYRNRFTAVKPGHVWADLPVPEFLERIGAYGRDREQGHSGLRLAGLLMFGRAEVIRDELPHYMVDYQERPEARAEKRWIDRLVPDGTWSGNVYDFFRLVYRKLTADLKVPFQLHDGQRIEDTPVHEALREALVNTLIHADFSGRASVLVVKRPDMFGFRNPGLMRIPPEQAVRGGTSDCRNRRLQVMFQLVGFGDHAGSGLPKIYRNWAEQHWRRPVLQENTELEQTLIGLHMSSLLPADAVTELEARLGAARCAELSALERLALVTAVAEHMINHTRLKEITTEHPSDLTKTLSALVRRGHLISEGTGRGTVYYPAWQRMGAALTPELSALTPELSALTPELPALAPELVSPAPEVVAASDLRVIVDLNMLSPEELDQLKGVAAPVARRARSAPEPVKQVVLALCRHHCMSLRALAELLGRHPDGVDLRKRILNPLVSSGQLLRIYPNPNDPRHAYRSAPTP